MTTIAQFVPLVLMLLMMALWQNAEWRVREGHRREARLRAMVESFITLPSPRDTTEPGG